MNKIIFLIWIFILGGLLIIKKSYIDSIPAIPNDIKATPRISVKPLNIIVPNSLKTNFKNSIEHCKTLNIAQNGAFENCMHNYIYRKSETDYDILTKISDYCERTTNTEYDRRECIDFKVKN